MARSASERRAIRLPISSRAASAHSIGLRKRGSPPAAQSRVERIREDRQQPISLVHDQAVSAGCLGRRQEGEVRLQVHELFGGHESIIECRRERPCVARSGQPGWHAQNFAGGLARRVGFRHRSCDEGFIQNRCGHRRQDGRRFPNRCASSPVAATCLSSSTAAFNGCSRRVGRSGNTSVPRSRR